MYGLDREMKVSLQKMRSLLRNFEEELKSLPPGSLYVRTVNQHTYYYHCLQVDGKWKRIFLKPRIAEDAALIRQLQRRRFILKSFPVLKKNILALEKATAKFKTYDPERICEELAPAYQGVENDQSLWLPGDPQLKAWTEEPYESSTVRPEELIYKAMCGMKARSRSESMIMDSLSYSGIPFRYEQILRIGGKSYAPTFTLLRPADHKLMYWEHFSSMDQNDYALEAAEKIIAYREAGLITGDNLIQTYEDQANPMTKKEIYDTIGLRLLI